MMSYLNYEIYSHYYDIIQYVASFFPHMVSRPGFSSTNLLIVYAHYEQHTESLSLKKNKYLQLGTAIYVIWLRERNEGQGSRRL